MIARTSRYAHSVTLTSVEKRAREEFTSLPSRPRRTLSRQRRLTRVGAGLLAAAFIAAGWLPARADAAPLVRSDAEATAGALTPVRDLFRSDLGGGTVAGANGLFSDATGARREINWDGVPAQFSAPNNLPANFFNVNSPRGVIFSTPGTGFQVSGATTDAGAGQPVLQFANIDASYPATFEVFSAQRLFTALGSNIVDVNFFVPGTSTPALTRGFGSIFTDVDVANMTSISFFDAANNLLDTFFVPALAGNETLSFLGVTYPTPLISRVRITNGNLALGAGVLDQNGDPNDLVVMDDFLYAEPVAAVPAPSTWILLVTALTGLGIAVRRRSA